MNKNAEMAFSYYLILNTKMAFIFIVIQVKNRTWKLPIYVTAKIFFASPTPKIYNGHNVSNW